MFMLLTDLKNCFASRRITAQGPKNRFFGADVPRQTTVNPAHHICVPLLRKNGESDQNLLSWIENDYSCEQPSANNQS